MKHIIITVCAFFNNTVSPFGKYIYYAGLLLLFISSRGFSQNEMVQTVNATTIQEIRVLLTTGVRVNFETRNLSKRSDPVLNLISPSGIEVAANDNSDNSRAGFASKISYIPSRTGWHILIVRAKQSTMSGTADIFKDNILLAANISFGGILLSLKNLRAGEAVQTVKIPKSAKGKDRLYILKNDSIGIQLYGLVRGGNNIAQIQINNNLGNRTAMVGSEAGEGAIRVICNDANLFLHDHDKDGLGIELEKELGTCPSRSGSAKGFDCSSIADARDTDGDGLPDGWEVLGRSDVTPFQSLPLWGADPRHKDMFMEVDFMRRTGIENTEGTIKRMAPAVARHFATIYGDGFTTDPLRRLAHATVLKNPDGNPGISVHLDTGVDPESDADAAIYGNWGGFNAVNAISANGNACSSGTANGDCSGVAATAAWKANMLPARRGIFRYALGYSGGGGSCGAGFACAFNFSDLTNPAHEWGHTFGLGHSGPMGITGDVDPNCKPNYASIMNYAFLGQHDVGFSDGIGFPPINNAAVKEWNAVSPSNKLYLDVLKNGFRYLVDTVNGHVDWNRNGIFEPANQLVRAYANYRPGSACEFTRYNQSEILNAETATTPVLARFRDRLYMFYNKDGAVKYRYSTSAWNCPQPSTATCDNGTWSNEKDAGMQQSVGVAVMNDLVSLRIVSVKFNGNIIERRLSINAGIESLTVTKQIPGSANGEPSLSFGLTGSFLVYKGTDMLIHFNRLIAGEWQNDQVAYKSVNEPVRSTSLWAFPNIIQTYLPWRANEKGLYGLFPAEDAKLDMWWYNPSTNFWEKTNVLENPRPGPIHSKPSIAYVPYRNEMENPGKIYMVYIKQSAGGSIFTGDTRMRMSYVKDLINADGTIVKEEKIGLDSYFDNSWFNTYGISIFFEPGKDINLRSVYTAANGSKKLHIFFRPKADGINDFSYKNYNDWETIRKNLCKEVVNPGGLVSNPVGCPLQ
ncbi:MAG: hypothetical protein ABIN97_19360 [Ginsengibacter sp.]